MYKALSWALYHWLFHNIVHLHCLYVSKVSEKGANELSVGASRQEEQICVHHVTLCLLGMYGVSNSLQPLRLRGLFQKVWGNIHSIYSQLHFPLPQVPITYRAPITTMELPLKNPHITSIGNRTPDLGYQIQCPWTVMGCWLINVLFVVESASLYSQPLVLRRDTCSLNCVQGKLSHCTVSHWFCDVIHVVWMLYKESASLYSQPLVLRRDTCSLNCVQGKLSHCTVSHWYCDVIHVVWMLYKESTSLYSQPLVLRCDTCSLNCVQGKLSHCTVSHWYCDVIHVVWMLYKESTSLYS